MRKGGSYEGTEAPRSRRCLFATCFSDVTKLFVQTLTFDRSTSGNRRWGGLRVDLLFGSRASCEARGALRGVDPLPAGCWPCTCQQKDFTASWYQLFIMLFIILLFSSQSEIDICWLSAFSALLYVISLPNTIVCTPCHVFYYLVAKLGNSRRGGELPRAAAASSVSAWAPLAPVLGWQVQWNQQEWSQNPCISGGNWIWYYSEG